MKTGILCMIALTGSTMLLAACSGAREEDQGSASKLVATLSHDYAFGLQANIKGKNKTSGEISTTTVKLYGRVTVDAQADSSVKFSLNTCNIVLPQVGGYQPLIDDNFLSNVLPAVNYNATLTEAGDLTAPTQAVLIGVRNLANPVTDPIPASASSPNVFDQDHDGKPGVSVSIDTGILGVKHVFAGARLLAGFTGKVGTDGKIVGTGTADSDFAWAIYGDDIPFVDVASQANDALANIEILSKKTSFVAVPKAAGLTCAQVKANLPAIPAPAPEAPVDPSETATGNGTTGTEAPAAPTEG